MLDARSWMLDKNARSASGGSAAPSGDVNFGAEGAPILASSKGLLDPRLALP